MRKGTKAMGGISGTVVVENTLFVDKRVLGSRTRQIIDIFLYQKKILTPRD
jgi:hypothetical protein